MCGIRREESSSDVPVQVGVSIAVLWFKNNVVFFVLFFWVGYVTAGHGGAYAVATFTIKYKHDYDDERGGKKQHACVWR